MLDIVSNIAYASSTKDNGPTAIPKENAMPTKSIPTIPGLEDVADTIRTQYLTGVRQQQKLALEAAGQWAEAVQKLLPALPNPYAEEWRKVTKANFEFATELLETQQSFATSLIDVLVPASV
jgi:hypothetical protein